MGCKNFKRGKVKANILGFIVGFKAGFGELV